MHPGDEYHMEDVTVQYRGHHCCFLVLLFSSKCALVCCFLLSSEGSKGVVSVTASIFQSSCPEKKHPTTLFSGARNQSLGLAHAERMLYH